MGGFVLWNEYKWLYTLKFKSFKIFRFRAVIGFSKIKEGGGI